MQKGNQEYRLFEVLHEHVSQVSPRRSLRGLVIPLDVMLRQLDWKTTTHTVSTLVHTYDDLIRSVREHRPAKRGPSIIVAIGIAKEWQPPRYRDELLRLLETPPDTAGKPISWSTEYSIPRGRTVRPRRTKKW